MKDKIINVYGAGLAGCEAAWQAAQKGVSVRLFEMKPEKYTPAHHSSDFAELVCSNSLRSDSITNAVGLLKEEMLLKLCQICYQEVIKLKIHKMLQIDSLKDNKVVLLKQLILLIINRYFLNLSKEMFF